ncbi:MAG TPA: hypothetical protein VFA98_12755 [Thermoanaerobaculia bacterium]|nr:hypothetical protein [Thermoanaerobaculia bacterium]
MKIEFDLVGFSALPASRKSIVLRAALEALVVSDWNYLLENPGTPSLYDFGSHGGLKKVRSDLWKDIPAIIATGGDGKSFACWRVAELRNAGTDEVYPHIKVHYPEPGVAVHQIGVRIGDLVEFPEQMIGAKG